MGERKAAVSRKTRETGISVDVRWGDRSEFPGWIEVTRFILKRTDAGWRVVEAVDPAASEEASAAP